MNETTDKLYTSKEVKSIKFNTICTCITVFSVIIIILMLMALFVLKKYNITDIKKIAQIYDIYNNHYLNDFDNTKATNGAIWGIIASSNDKYGSYIPANNYDLIGSRYMTGHYKGFGMTLLYLEQEEKISIQKIIKDSPADKANLKIGQNITKINNKTISEEIYKEFITQVQNSELQSVELEIDNEFNVTLSTAEITPETVIYEIQDDIAYIKITRFVDKTEKDFKTAISNINKENVSKVVFDLRDDSGGNADSVIPMLDFILPSCLIADFKYADGKTNKFYSDKNYYLDLDKKIYLLSNNNTASASELFIMALQDNRNATLIGQQTYGKSTILSTYLFNDHSIFTLSTGTYYSSRYENIEGVGITPNIILNDTEIAYKPNELIKYFN